MARIVTLSSKVNSSPILFSDRPVSRGAFLSLELAGRALLIVLLFACVFINAQRSYAQDNATPSYASQTPSARSLQAREPRVTGVHFREIKTGAKIGFTLDIRGENFSGTPENTNVVLLTQEGIAVGEEIKVTEVTETHIVLTGKATAGKDIDRIRISLGGVPVETSDFKLALKILEKPAVDELEIKYTVYKNEQFPNLYSLLVTRENGRGKFENNPNRMKVEILPAGATNVTIRESNEQQLVVHFLAPQNFEVQAVVITVYDSSDLDIRRPVALAKPFREKPPKVDPNQPLVSESEVVFLQRDKGIGRLRISGSRFGAYAPPPLRPVDYLLCWPERSFRGRLYKNEKEERDKKTVPERKQEEQACSRFTDQDFAKMKEWRENVERNVSVVLEPRNPSLRVENTEIIYIDDKLIDVYFEFTRFKGYSQPFRLARATVTVKKQVVKTTQTLTAGSLIGTVTGPEQETFVVSKDVGPKRDENLQYRYTILDTESSRSLFGRGVSDNFYVIQLSVVNNGPRKVTVPLASIQAEIEWYKGPSPKDEDVEYLEGPVTLSPVPLAAVSAFFDAYVKTKGKRAVLFNIVDGITTLGAAIIPFAGPSFKDGHVVFTAGFIPGLRKAVGDLSSQQLQNLTSLSWESTETIASKGGSKEKFIYIPRGIQWFAQPAEDVSPVAKGKISSILGLEVIGFEVAESEAKAATEK